MSKQVLRTDNAPKAIGPYSQGIKTGGLVFTSGQLPVDPATGKLVTDDIGRATAQSLENVRAILQSAGADMADVVKVTVYLKDLKDFAAMNEVYAGYFKEAPPARSCFQVAELPMGAMVEIEAVAWAESE